MTTINLDYQPNAAYYGDCEEIIQAWKEQGVQGIIDLIYLDPPFNSKRNYGDPTSKAKKSDTGSMDAFVDMWTYDQQARERVDRICNQQKLHPARLLIQSLKPYLEENDDGMLAYISYMADRLRLLHGLLRDTGSIYLHCNQYANYYLRMLMDSIFGAENFRNEIVWHHPKIGIAKNKFTSNVDTILCYSKSETCKFTPQTTGEPNELFERWKRKIRGKKLYYSEAKTIKDSPAKSKIKVLEKKLGRKLKDNDVVVDFNLAENHKVLDNVWKIPFLRGNSEEYLGYPTQKPLKLLDRIIQASTNEGDIVLDPFCGCGTAMHSAVQNKRRFIGMDISVFTIYEVARKRLKRECGLDVPIYGIPTNFAGAKLLAKKDKKKFEAWASESLNFGNIGIISNKIKTCDGGIDGSGLLYGQTEYGEDKIIVQVKGGGFTIDQVRAFKDRINSIPGVAAGIFITLDGDNPKSAHRWTKGMEKEALDCGTFKMPNGEQSFRRMQHWSVRDRFKGDDGVYPKMPITINQHTEKPMVEIGTTIPNKPLPLASKPAKRNRRRNGKTKAYLF